MNAIPAADRIIRHAFPGIPPREAEELVAIGEVKSYPQGVVLCKENAIEYTFFIILEGEVEVTKTINADAERILKHLGEGDFFGEMGLIHNAPRVATVKSTSPIKVLEIHKSAFDRLLQQSSSMSLAMVREVSRRLRENDEMAIEDLRLKAGELAVAYQRLAQEELARREFLTTIAHELRTPLTVARGFLEMARTHDLDAQSMNEVLETVARNTEQIVTLVNDILFLQEVELVMPEMHPLDVAKLVRAVVTEITPNAKASGIPVQVILASDLPFVMGHAGSLQRALIQLAENAIKYSQPGCKISITAENSGNGVRIAVQDQGAGIADDAVDHIFERFFHIDEVDKELYGGLGLGLAITKQVVEQHNGRIEVESQVGVGSRFTLFFEAASAEELCN